jgi:hypothetical protein
MREDCGASSEGYCREAEPGLFFDTKTQTFIPCPSGKFAPEKQTISCKACPLGKFQNEPGTTFCVDCEVFLI